MMETLNNEPGIAQPRYPVFQELHNYFSLLYETVPHEDTSSRTRTLVLAPDEAARILDAVRCTYCHDDNINGYFIKLADAVAHSPKRLPDGKKPVIVQDSLPGNPTEYIYIKIPSPDKKLNGVLMSFERTRNPNNKGLFKIIEENGDLIERSDVELLYNFPQEVQFFRLYDALGNILKERTAPHYTRSEKLHMFLRDLVEYMAKDGTEV
jgi:hypothetical protein